MASQESTTQRWVSALKGAYPNLPDSLTLDVELQNLDRLKDWFKNIHQYRKAYDGMDRSMLPIELQDETGKRQIIPVLLSLDEMTQDERQAWHELFVCLSAHMADIAYNYWKTHASTRATLSLEDTLNYLPVVFLYVLSAYKEYPKGENPDVHSDNFSSASDGRVKLITWVHIESRRHINTYLQQHAYTVKQGSGYTHRLRQAILKIQGKAYTETGVEPSETELIDELTQTHYGQIVSPDTLAGHVHDVLTSRQTMSISEPLYGDTHDGAHTYEDLITETNIDVQSDLYDPCSYLEKRTAPIQSLHNAVTKLLYTKEKLSFLELTYLGT